MKTKHKKLSLLLSLSMLMGASPTMVFADDFTLEETLIENAADNFAADEEIGRPVPDELPVVYEGQEISTFTELPYNGSGTKSDPYIVDIVTTDDFQELREYCSSYRKNGYFNVTLKNNLDLTELEPPAKWGAYLKFFMGTFNGGEFNISGIPSDCFLFYQIHNADIKNLTLDLNGQAGALIYYAFRIDFTNGTTEWGRDTLSNITVKSATPIKLTDNSQANYSPFLYSSSPYFTMKDCTNYADITGNTYAAAFYGYYPLPLDLNVYPDDAKITFDNCVNHGNINLRYAGLFFGNPTGLCQERNIEFKNCVNYGEVRGTESAHFFSSDAGSNDYYTGNGYFTETENVLDPKDNSGKPLDTSPMRQKCEDSNCIHNGKSGQLYVGDAIEGLGIEVVTDSNGIQRYKVVGTDSKHTYSVTAFYYVHMFLIDENTGVLTPDGNTRVSLTEDGLNSENYTTSIIEDAKLHNGTMPENYMPEDEEQCLFYCADAGESHGYWLDSDLTYGDNHRLYIREDKAPAKVNWEVYVSAYDKETGLPVDTAELVRTK